MIADLTKEVETELERVRKLKEAALVWGPAPLIDSAIRQAERALELKHPANLILACNKLRSVK